MDETRLRAVIREEIALAVKTLGQATEWTEGDEDALTAVQRTVDMFGQSYPRACEAADEERAENPFAETTPGEDALKLTRDEVLSVLKEMRSAFYMSGMPGDYMIAERLDQVIEGRERSTDE